MGRDPAAARYRSLAGGNEMGERAGRRRSVFSRHGRQSDSGQSLFLADLHFGRETGFNDLHPHRFGEPLSDAAVRRRAQSHLRAQSRFAGGRLSRSGRQSNTRAVSQAAFRLHRGGGELGAVHLSRAAPLGALDLKNKNPQELFRDYRFWVACEADEELPHLLNYIGEDHIVIGSDYGHNDPSKRNRSSSKICAPAKTCRRMSKEPAENRAALRRWNKVNYPSLNYIGGNVTVRKIIATFVRLKTCRYISKRPLDAGFTGMTSFLCGLFTDLARDRNACSLMQCHRAAQDSYREYSLLPTR